MQYLDEDYIREQRVDVYLNDLKKRLKLLRLKHEEIIENSVNIIKEINMVSNNFSERNPIQINHGSCVREKLPTSEDNSLPNMDSSICIRKLIESFEAGSSNITVGTSQTFREKNHDDVNRILCNFEQLKESKVLAESLLLFRKAKESFEKIDTFFEGLNQRAHSRPHMIGTEFKEISAKMDSNANTQSTSDSLEKPNINGNDEKPLPKFFKDSYWARQTPINSDSNITLKGVCVREKIKLFNRTGVSNNAEKSNKNKNIDSKTSNKSESERNDKITEALPAQVTESPQENEVKKVTSTASCDTNYVSCCGSELSLGEYFSADNLLEPSVSQALATEKGYEGDYDDSEYDLLAHQKNRRR